MNIVVVDDDEACRMLIACSLATKFPQSSVTSLENGQQAIALLHRSILPDLIITDFRMPEIDGLEFIKWLSESPCHREIPVIMYTSEDEEGVMQRAKDQGCLFFNKASDSLSDVLLAVADKLGLKRC